VKEGREMELAIKILADFYARHGYLEHMADPTAIIQDRCYQVLCRIKGILEDGRSAVLSENRGNRLRVGRNRF